MEAGDTAVIAGIISPLIVLTATRATSARELIQPVLTMYLLRGRYRERLR